MFLNSGICMSEAASQCMKNNRSNSIRKGF
jgi:hypothetical protein